MQPTAMDDQTRQLHIIWIAFLAAVALYVPIPWLIIAAGADTAAAPPPDVRSGLNFAALGAGVSSFVARRWWTSSLLAALHSGPGAQVSADAWTRLRTGCLITWALSEAVAVIGLAQALVTREPSDAVVPAAAAALLLYRHRPESWPLQAVARTEGQPA